MTFTLDHAVVYDIETLPNVFTLNAQSLYGDFESTWEISWFRDDRIQMLQWFNHLRLTQAPMIGFNNLGFDYPVIHFIMMHPQCTIDQIYQKAQSIITGNDRFSHMIWPSDRFAPQIDLFKIHHFDNRAKTTSLKALQINMRSETVVESSLGFGINYTAEQIDGELIPYNKHDVKETKAFTFHTLKAINFRIGLIDEYGIEVLNYNDTKIGSKILEHRLGEHVCYDKSSGRKQPRQTPRWRIDLAEIIFPYISFDNPEFQRVLEYMKAQVLVPDDLTDPEATIKTKGVFSNLKANVGGLEFHFGTGGIHGSISAQRIMSDDEWLIRDIDVASLYPSIAIVNKLYPAHLGEAFVHEYEKIPLERGKHKKGTIENAALKLAANGTYGNSNNKYSVFYDPQFTMTITINGQLMLCMLAERLALVPTIQMVQINTDGLTYRIHIDHEPQAAQICKDWEAFTCLVLESVDYSRVFIRDVNNYIAEYKVPAGSNQKPKLKQKGAYWFPDPLDYADSISNNSPPAWHKDLGNIISQRAALAAMIDDVDPETFIRAHTDPFDFMLRAKVNRASKLMLGDQQIQSTSRYYVATNGQELIKVSPPAKDYQVGAFKRASKVPDSLWASVNADIPIGSWDVRIHTKNKSKYTIRRMNMQAGWKCAECNDAKTFDFANIDYAFYVNEAKKLII